MLRRIIFAALICTFASASDSLVYSADKKDMLERFFSSKQAELIRNLYISFDLGSALVILDDRFVNDITHNSPKRLNPDKTLLTLSYRF
jgi:hypothetical protein